MSTLCKVCYDKLPNALGMGLIGWVLGLIPCTGCTRTLGNGLMHVVIGSI